MEYQKKSNEVKKHVYQLIDKINLQDTSKRTMVIHIENEIPLRLQELFKKYGERKIEIIEACVIEGKLILVGIKSKFME